MPQRGTYLFTKQAKSLYDALVKNGIDAKSEYWDGHKHVDIAIPSANIIIEVDGLHHFTEPKQIEADFKRSHYSDLKNKFDTIHIPNLVVEKHLDDIVSAIVEIVRKRG